MMVVGAIICFILAAMALQKERIGKAFWWLVVGIVLVIFKMTGMWESAAMWFVPF
nr:hypothetical protein [Eubacterium sp.]